MRYLVRAVTLSISLLPFTLTTACAATKEAMEPREEVSPGSSVDLLGTHTCRDKDNSALEDCHRINIGFLKDENGILCPTFVGQPVTIVERAKLRGLKLQWQAVQYDMNGERAEVNAKYAVIFSPFQGHALRSENNGATPPRSVDWELMQLLGSAEQEYPAFLKYTILGEDCPAKPLDPRIRVH